MADILSINYACKPAKAYHIYAHIHSTDWLHCESWFMTLTHAIAFAIRSISYPKQFVYMCFDSRKKIQKPGWKSEKTTHRTTIDKMKALPIDTVGCTRTTHNGIFIYTFLWQIFRYITWLIAFLFHISCIVHIQVHWSHKFYSISFKD